MARLLFSVLGTSVAVTLIAVGCGSNGDESNFGSSGGSSGDGTSSGSSGFGTSGGVPGSSGASGSSGAGTVGNVDPNSACANSSAGTSLPPISLIFMIDRSGSMGNSNQGQNLAVRWNPVSAGVKAFLTDPASAGVKASVAFFGSNNNGNFCDGSLAGPYGTPVLQMTALPTSTDPFTGVSPGGNTPTKPAMEGAVAYAQQIAAALKPGEKAVIVLATDGQPNDNCSTQSTVQNTADVAKSVAATIPTYVIGVGPDTGNLDLIASSGGTSKAILVATSTGPQVAADLRTAIGKIKASTLGCNYGLPAPPSGQSLDVNAVNVNYTPGAGGGPTTLPYSADCSNPNGWHYDNTSAPTQIVMCSSTCTTLQADTAGGKVDIIFGCQTAVPPGGSPPK